ncbi:MAG: hypothetical protein AB1762_20400 [Gemmatimonadota bacterium]
MFGSQRWAVKGEEPATLDTIHDAEREIIVVEHAPHIVSGLFMVKVRARRRLCRSLSTWN